VGYRERSFPTHSHAPSTFSLMPLATQSHSSNKFLPHNSLPSAPISASAFRHSCPFIAQNSLQHVEMTLRNIVALAARLLIHRAQIAHRAEWGVARVSSSDDLEVVGGRAGGCRRGSREPHEWKGAHQEPPRRDAEPTSLGTEIRLASKRCATRHKINRNTPTRVNIAGSRKLTTSCRMQQIKNIMIIF
jgi:hypothetical protein